MSEEERHPLVQKFIDICEDATKQKEDSNYQQLYKAAEQSGALSALRAVGFTEDKIEKFLRSQMK